MSKRGRKPGARQELAAQHGVSNCVIDCLGTARLESMSEESAALLIPASGFVPAKG